MQEALWVLGLLLAIGAYAAVGAVPADQLVMVGQFVMLRSAAFGVPLEVVYFGLMTWALWANGDAPRRWYMRSFEHHGRLRGWQRLWILPPFYAGALAFLGISLGIVISLLGFVAVLGLGKMH
ncbi:MAG: hypothetical protein ABW321_20905 [Polyangiales bacterium]